MGNHVAVVKSDVRLDKSFFCYNWKFAVMVIYKQKNCPSAPTYFPGLKNKQRNARNQCMLIQIKVIEKKTP